MPTPTRRKGSRRTGVIFLVLIAATNVVVWMEPVARSRISGDLAESSEMRLALTSCLIAACLSLAAWLLGRRSGLDRRPGTSNARLWGLVLSLVSAFLNLGVVGASLFLVAPSRGAISQITLLASVWCLLLLPLQLAAAYAMGRGSSIDRRLVPPS